MIFFFSNNAKNKQDGTMLPVKRYSIFRGTTRYASLRAHQKLELGLYIYQTF